MVTESSDRLRVLVADDDPMVLSAITHHLSQIAWSVDQVTSGEEAMEMLLTEDSSTSANGVSTMHPANQRFPFADYTGRGIKVAVVGNSGMDVENPILSEDSFKLLLEKRKGQSLPDNGYEGTHGTLCGLVVRWLAPEARILGIQMLDRRLSSNGPGLVDALAWAVDEGAQIICFSVGIQHPTEPEALRQACDCAVHCSGTVLIHAVQNGSGGAMAGSVGVASARIEEKYGYRRSDGPGVSFAADEGLEGVPGAAAYAIKGRGVRSGFAAPRLAALAALVREAMPSAGPEEVVAVLKRNAVR